MKEKKYNFWRFIYFPIAFAYVELIFHIAIYKNEIANMLYPTLFAVTLGVIVALISCVGNKIVNAILSYALVITVSFYYVVQLVYYSIFKTFLSLVSVGGAGDAMNFKVVMFQAIGRNIGWILAIFLPVIVLVLLQIFVISFARPHAKQVIINAIVVAIMPVISILALNISGRKPYSPYDLFHGKYVLEQSMSKLGLPITTLRDAMALAGANDETMTFELNEDMLLGEEENNSEIDEESAVDQNFDDNDNIAANDTDKANNDKDNGIEETKVYKPQIDETVDFKKLYNKTDDETLKNLSAYFSNRKPTYENEYTGLFEGYNLVFVTAESLSRYGISDKCTPSLYKIMNDGFVFDNFYNPRWYHSTIDGEYVNCLGQYPSSSDWSFYKSAATYQPYAMGNALNALGYKSYAYHDFNFYYYNRSETHANMGYDFKAIDYGLEIPYNATYSDLDTMEAVYEEFINEEHFNMYFMSFSGHLPYDYSYQAMCLKNKEEAEKLTEGMGLSETAIAYIAAQMELDKALGFLIDRLEEAGKLDNTVFVVTPDHYPYGLPDGVYDELAGAQIENDPFELHRSCLGIYNSSMEEPVIVDELCASVDVLPTILNLFGIDYDSRVLAGNDILANTENDPENLVIFADHSFITDRVKYNATKGEVTYLVDEHKVSQEYIDSVIKKVENIIYISDIMIDKDYYGFMYDR